jgi:hypothetical protein
MNEGSPPPCPGQHAGTIPGSSVIALPVRLSRAKPVFG